MITIIIKKVNSLKVFEMDRWIIENSSQGALKEAEAFREIHHGIELADVCYSFTDQEDAMAFKLRWV